MVMKTGLLSVAFGLVLAAGASRAVAETSPSAFKLLPAETALTLVLDTTDETWSQLSQFQFFNLLTGYTGTTLNPAGLPYLPLEISYQAEVAPWIGDSAVLALMPMPAVAVDLESQLLLIAPIADFAAFDGFLEQIAATRSQSPTAENHRNVSIYVWPPEALPQPQSDADLTFNRGGDRWYRAVAPLPPPNPTLDLEPEAAEPQPPMLPSLAVAVLPGYLVMSAQAAPIQQLIDAQLSQSPTLLESANFQKTLTNPDFDSALVTLFGNVGQINRYVVSDPTLLESPLPTPFPLPLPLPRLDFSPEDIQALTETDTFFESFVKPTTGGILSQGRVYFDPKTQLTAPVVERREADVLPSLLPAPTYALSSGYDLGGFGLSLLQLLESLNIEQINTGLTFLNMAVTAATGLDLETDILAWMDGAFGFFLFPSRESLVSEFAPQVELGIGLMLQTSDRAAAESALQAFEQFLSSNEASVEAQTINGVAATRWQIELTPAAELTDIVGYGWSAADVLTLTVGSGALRRLLNPQPDEFLAEHPTFQNAIAPFPADNNGYFYVNIGSTLSFLYRAIGLTPDQPFMLETQRMLGTLRSLSLTTSQTADYAQADLFLGLAPAEE
ncbi:DUF3352 domain-containing protein [Almyronema epifaneia]|uniref:DUF3352 domain-containing protein n=1 Tax=Almyronema epifaneia S1 TaxID=2991925 RepID=A0ABW6IIL6_9CYAN